MIRRRLDAAEISTLAPYIPRVDLDAAVLHLGRVPWYLPGRFGAIVRGNHIHVRAGADAMEWRAWIGLLGHELTHVGQYRRGMTVLKYLCSAAFGYRNSVYEREAFAVQARILNDLPGGGAVLVRTQAAP